MGNNKHKAYNNHRKRRNIIITFIIIIILMLLGLFGCKVYNDKLNNKYINFLPKLNEEGYWFGKDEEKLTDKKSNLNNLNCYEYYKLKDKDYKKSIKEFYNEFNNDKLNYKFKVNFYVDDKLINDSYEASFLNSVKFPKDPIKDGYIFKGWRLDNYNNDILFTSLNNILIDDNLNFYSIFKENINPELEETYKVIFYIDNNLYKEYEVERNKTIEPFDNPAKDNTIFLGWYDEFDNPYKFNNPIIKDTSLHAKFFNIKNYDDGIKKHQVTFLDDLYNVYKTFYIKNFEQIEPFEGKAKEGYRFIRWVERDSLETFSFDTKITKSYVLVPEYEINKFKVSFVGEDIINLPSEINDIPYNSTLLEPDISLMKKEHYHFINKYLDQDNNEFIFGTTKVKKDLILTPVFEIDRFNITFKNNPDFINIPSTINNIAYGSKVDFPENYSLFKPSDEGFMLAGLFYNDENGVEQEFKFNETIVTSDIELTIKKKIKVCKINVYDHLDNLISSNELNYNSEVTLKRFTNDYVYEYYYNSADESEHYSSIKDYNFFSFNLKKDLDLKVKAHKKHIKFITTDNNIKVIDNNNEVLTNKLLEVVTNQAFTLPKVKKDNYYRINPVVWQKEEGGVKTDYNETIYNYNYDLTLYLKNESSIFDDVFLYEEEDDHINIKGLNDKYKSVPDFDLNIPELIDDKIVTSIRGFSGLTNINKVVLTNNVKTIKDSCFQYSSIKEINLENSKIENLAYACFMGCNNLTKIKFPATLKQIGMFALQNLNSLEEVDYSLTSIDTIMNGTFYECKNLKKVILPPTLKLIKTCAFCGCKKLNDINIHETVVEKIEDSAFKYNNSLVNVKLPSTLKNLSCYVYDNSENLETINLKDTNLDELVRGAFCHLPKLNKVVLPSSLKYLREYSFYNCPELKEVNFEETSIIEIDDYAFFDLYKLDKFVMPATCTKLGKRLFNTCQNIKLIDLSLTNIETIQEGTFKRCLNLETLKLPHSIKKIETDAFTMCSNFNLITFEGTEAEFRAITLKNSWINGVMLNPIIKFNDGTSIHLNDL